MVVVRCGTWVLTQAKTLESDVCQIDWKTCSRWCISTQTDLRTKSSANITKLSEVSYIFTNMGILVCSNDVHCSFLLTYTWECKYSGASFIQISLISDACLKIKSHLLVYYNYKVIKFFWKFQFFADDRLRNTGVQSEAPIELILLQYHYYQQDIHSHRFTPLIF